MSAACTYPKPDRSDYEPRRARTGDDTAIDLGWDEAFLKDGRPYRVEAWSDEGVTMLTYFFSTRGIETWSNEQLAKLLESEGLVRFLYPDRHVTAMPVTDAAGNDMWSVNVIVGTEDETYISDSTRLRSYWTA
jgi:hypothetical protein